MRSDMEEKSVFSELENLRVISCAFFALIAILTVVLPLSSTLADAGGSGQADAGAAHTSNAPRKASLETSNNRLELVARLHHKKLLIYVDHFATNEPLLNASIQARLGKVQATAMFEPNKKEYEIADPIFLAVLSQGGEHKLDFTINGSDTLSGSMSVAADEVKPSLLWLAILAIGVIVTLIADRTVGRRMVRESPSSREDRQSTSYHGLCIACIAIILTIGLYHSPVSAEPKRPSHDFEVPGAFKSEGLARLSDGTVNIPKQMQRRLGIQTLVVADTLSDLDLRHAARSFPPATATSSPLPNAPAPPAPTALNDENVRSEKTRTTLPPESVVRNPHGLSIVWIKISAERFAEVAVNLHRYRDGKAVIEGIPSNSRVVISGADLINQIR